MAEQKRSSNVFLISAGALAAAAGIPIAFNAFGSTSATCYPSYVYQSVESCQANARFSPDICNSMFREAESEIIGINGFDTLAQCSAVYRASDCEQRIGGSWKPRMTGYRVFDRKGQTPPQEADPLFTSPDGKWKSADGTTIAGDTTCRGTRRTSHYYTSPRYFGQPAPQASPSGPGILRRVFGGTPRGFGPRVSS